MRCAWADHQRGFVARRSRFLVAALAAALGGGAMPAAQDGGASVAPPALRLRADAEARPASARAFAELDWVGGRFTLATGGAVTVYVSRKLAGNSAAPRRWADHLGGLVHRDELGALEAYIAPSDEVGELCGADALGCYENDTLVSIGETVDGVTPEEVVAHEYGHHVAHHRANPPWRSLDYGTKRWATHSRICARAAAGEVFPGDEEHGYELNPGEAFAEAYRALVESKRGAQSFAWTLVDRSFYPDDRALALVEEDVLRPWSPRRATSTSVRLRRGARTWTHVVPTALDGDVEVSLRLAAGIGAKLDVFAVDGATTHSRGRWTGTTEQRATLRVCGSRSARIRVAAPAGTRFSVSVSKP